MISTDGRSKVSKESYFGILPCEFSFFNGIKYAKPILFPINKNPCTKLTLRSVANAKNTQFVRTRRAAISGIISRSTESKVRTPIIKRISVDVVNYFSFRSVQEKTLQRSDFPADVCDSISVTDAPTMAIDKFEVGDINCNLSSTACNDFDNIAVDGKSVRAFALDDIGSPVVVKAQIMDVTVRQAVKVAGKRRTTNGTNFGRFALWLSIWICPFVKQTLPSDITGFRTGRAKNLRCATWSKFRTAITANSNWENSFLSHANTS